VTARNAYSFFEPIDQAYFAALADFANWKGLLYVSPFWTQCFSAYLDYNQVGSLSAAQVTSMEHAAAATALGADQTTLSGLTYGSLVQGIPPAYTLSAADFVTGIVATDSLVTIFGSNLSTGTASAPSLPLPATLADTTVSIEDSSGNQQPVQLFFVSPGQINGVIPTGLSSGATFIKISSQGKVVAQSDVALAAIGPALFTANQNGQGVPVGVVVTAQPDGTQTTAYTYQGTAVGNYTPAPINLGGPEDSSALVLYGTGIRGNSSLGSLANVTVTIGTIALPVQYAGPCDPAQFAGFDQVNVALPYSLAGAGQVTVTLTVDGVSAPPVALAFQ
jgi:uncharacterized protein (TIGR03437 family)